MFELQLPNTKMVECNKIHPSPKNSCSGDRANIDELAVSIKGQGLIHAPMVREISPDYYEIVVGERRWRACCTIAETMPVDIRILTDAEAYAITIVENLHRKDLNPIEEAASIDYLQSLGDSPEQIADKIGKTVKWVARRSKLINLSMQIKERYLAGETQISRWTTTHLELIARFSHEVQEQVVNGILEYDDISSWGCENTVSIADLEDKLDTIMCNMSSTVWKLTDEALLPEAGACSSCMKRTACQMNLFDQIEIKGKTVDRCIDPICFDKKKRIFTEKKEAELKSKNPDLITLCDFAGQEEHSDAILSHRVLECKKSDPGAQQALVVSGSDAGRLKWVKVPDNAAKSKSGTNTFEDKTARLTKKRSVKVIVRIIEILTQEIAVAGSVINSLTDEVVVILAVIFGARRYDITADDPDFSPTAEVLDHYKTYNKIRKSEMYRDLARCIFPGIVDILRHQKDGQTVTLDFAEKICDILKIDYKEIVRNVELEVKAPKSLIVAEPEEYAPKKSKKSRKIVDKADKKESPEKGWTNPEQDDDIDPNENIDQDEDYPF